MDNLYSLETRKQADVKNLKDAYISELEIENEHLKMQLEEIQINESEDKEKNNRASNPGSEAASEKRLQPWKDVYFPAIHAVAPVSYTHLQILTPDDEPDPAFPVYTAVPLPVQSGAGQEELSLIHI